MSTALLAKLKAVFADGASPIVSRPTVQPLALAQYTAGHIWVECVNADGTAHALTYDTLLLGVRFHPTDADPAIMVQLTNTDADPDGTPAENWARAELVPGHWSGVPPRIYAYDVVALVGGDPDDRLPVIPSSQWKTTPENVHPGDDVEVPAAQQPLAQGPRGTDGVVALPSEPLYPAVPYWTGAAWVWQQVNAVTITLDGSTAQPSANWPQSFGSRPYRVVGIVLTTDDETADNPGEPTVIGKNDSKVTIQLSGLFTGTLDVKAEEIIS